MTYEEIDALSGRELDELIAEHIMGWRRLGKGEWVSPGHGPNGDIIDEDSKGEHDYLESPDKDRYYFCPCKYTYRGDYQTDWLPRFSTDVDAAWQIIDELKDHYSFGIWHASMFSSVMSGYLVVFRDSVHLPELYKPDQDDDFGGHGETLPLAVCHAALAIKLLRRQL